MAASLILSAGLAVLGAAIAPEAVAWVWDAIQLDNWPVPAAFAALGRLLHALVVIDPSVEPQTWRSGWTPTDLRFAVAVALGLLPSLWGARLALRRARWLHAVHRSEAFLAMRALLDGPALSETQRVARDWLEDHGVEAGPAPAATAPRQERTFADTEADASAFLRRLQRER